MAGVDFIKIEESVNNCCLKCEDCSGKKCLVGFPKGIVSYVNETHEKRYPNAIKAIPTKDMKIFEESAVVDGIAELLVQCRECGADHDKDCVINTIRASLERAAFGDNLEDFKGSPLMHIMELSTENKRLGDKILASYKEKKV